MFIIFKLLWKEINDPKLLYAKITGKISSIIIILRVKVDFRYKCTVK